MAFLTLLLTLALGGCGGSSASPPDQLTLTNVSIGNDLPPAADGNGNGNPGGGPNGGGNGANGGQGNGGDGGGSNGGNGGAGNGGNGSDTGEPATPGDDAPHAPSAPSLSVACAVENCAALSNDWYAGSGTGIWRYRNTGSGSVTLPIDIGGLNSASLVSLIFTNEENSAKALPAGRKNPVPAAPETVGNHSLAPCPQPQGAWRQRGQYSATPDAPPQAVAYVYCTSKVLSASAHDGRAIDVWVEQGEGIEGRITRSLIDNLMRRFALDTAGNVYDLVSGITGAPWGRHQNGIYISDAAAPAAPLALNLVFVNSIPERTAPGHHLAQLNTDNLKVKAFLGQDDISARQLSIFIDSAALYTNPALLIRQDDGTASLNESLATEYLKSELSRELTRLAVFYQRGLAVSERYILAPWLEDLVASMMQYSVDSRLGSFTGSDGRKAAWSGVAMPLADWFEGLPSCAVLARPSTRPAQGFCSSDGSSVAFAVYLMNQYGMGLLRRLLAVELVTSEIDYAALLDRRIQQSGGPGFTASLWRHGSSLGLLGKDPLPPRFGLPAFSASDFSYPAQPLNTLNRVARLPVDADDIAAVIAPYGHVAARRNSAGANYSETVQVPAGVSVVVVIQPGN